MAKRKGTPRDKARAATKQKMQSTMLQMKVLQSSVDAMAATLKELSKSLEESVYQETNNAPREQGEM